MAVLIFGLSQTSQCSGIAYTEFDAEGTKPASRDRIQQIAQDEENSSTEAIVHESYLEGSYQNQNNGDNGWITASDFFVDNLSPASANDNQHGSIYMPWKTLSYAFHQLRPGEQWFGGGTNHSQGVSWRGCDFTRW
jgi:hypothetical protein